MKTVTIISFLAICNVVFSQKILNDFEQFLAANDTFDNGLMGSGGFLDSTIFLPNSYDHSFDSWGGWAISNKKDTMTPGFLNQYSCIAGGGAKESDTYAITSAFLPVTMQIHPSHSPTVIDTVYLNNSTYTYLSMRDGDQFAKRFGGETGDDPDFLKVSIKKYLDGELKTDSIEFFLADYRFEDNSNDYIVSDWTAIDLSPLGMVDSVLFTLFSSDVGAFGINTPAYFCMDYVVTNSPITNIVSDQLSRLQTFPNPARNKIYLRDNSDVIYSYTMFNQGGRALDMGSISRERPLDVSDLPSGSYFIYFHNHDRSGITHFIKE